MTDNGGVMRFAELAPWTIAWHKNKAHLFEDGETSVALCGNEVPRVTDRRLLVNPNQITCVYLNDTAFCFGCVRATRKRFGLRIDYLQLCYGDVLGWSDDPKDITIWTGPVDVRRAQSHHYHPIVDPQPDYVEVFRDANGTQYAWTFYQRMPVQYVATEIVPINKQDDVKLREAQRAIRAAGLGNNLVGDSLEPVTRSDIAKLADAAAHQTKMARRLSSILPTPQTKT